MIKRSEGKKVLRRSMLAAAIFMTAALMGCEKKAEVINGYDETADAVSDEKQDTAQSEKDSKEDGNTSDDTKSDEKKELEYWTETIQGNGEAFDSVSIKAKVNGNSGEDSFVSTVSTGDYDKAFMEAMCKQVFDGNVEVYDYKAKTKRLYDADIAMYEALKDMYLDENAGFVLESRAGEPEPGVDATKAAMDSIDKLISDLQSERDAAPDTIENDYSYGGYIGEINGNPYYMYFGNCNLDQYVQAPFSMNMNGRCCTIFRENVSELFDGMYGCTYQYQPVEGNATAREIPEDIVSAAKEFIDAIGYSDYKYSGDKSYGFVYRKGVDGVITYGKDIPYSQYSSVGPDDIQEGYIVTFNLSGLSDRALNFDAELFRLDPYAKDMDVMDINTCLNVFVNERGVLGCQMINPMTVIKQEQAESIISTDDVKDIIRDNIDNMDSWNVPEGFGAVNIEMNQLRLIDFPLRSDTDKSEYTYVPAYILYNTNAVDESARNYSVEGAGYGVRITTGPCMIINALDGSIIKVQDELTDHFGGYARGNEGFLLYESGGWERYQVVREHMNRFNDDPEDDDSAE